MAQEYDNTDRGVLFRNDRKEKPNQPDHTGNIDVKCPHCEEVSQFWLSAWIKEARGNGNKFFSLAINPKVQTGSYSPKSTNSGNDDSGLDDDIPF